MTLHSRRSFLKRSLGVVAALFGVALTGRHAAAGWFGLGGGKKDNWLSIGKLADLPDGQSTAIKTATRVADGKTVKTPKLIARRRGGEVRVMSTRCTHFGCEVQLQEDGTFLCPCHEAQYSATGAVTKGPAKKDLSWLESRIAESGEVEVNPASVIATPVAE